MMLIWFGMLGILGLIQITKHAEVLKAFNPYYAYNLLFNYHEGFWILGAVFLCTTGAEALYSDLGHCGKNNIRVSWFFVKSAFNSPKTDQVFISSYTTLKEFPNAYPF